MSSLSGKIGSDFTAVFNPSFREFRFGIFKLLAPRKRLDIVQLSRLLLPLAILTATAQMKAVDLYGAAPTARSIGLAGIFTNSTSGPTDALAANPAGLAFAGRPLLEISGMGVLASGTFRNSSPFAGNLDGNAGVAGSAALASRIGHSRISLGLGVFPVSLLSDNWKYFDPPGTAGVSYGLQANRSAFLALQPTIGLAVQVNSRVAVGVSLGTVYNANTLQTPYVFQNNAFSGLKTLLDLHTSGLGVNGSVGTIVRATRNIEFGAAYKTPTDVETHGVATGSASALFSALGVSSDPAFRYRARVDNIFPQTVSANVSWQARPRLVTHVQGDWINWQRSFVSLPVALTGGTNSTINSLLSSASLNDSVPLHWRNHSKWRAAVEYSLLENLTLLGGYSFASNPVPSRTLTPMTADIMQHGLSTGVAYHHNRYGIELAYQANLPASASVDRSDLLAGEYDHSRVNVRLQTVVLTTGIRF